MTLFEALVWGSPRRAFSADNRHVLIRGRAADGELHPCLGSHSSVTRKHAVAGCRRDQAEVLPAITVRQKPGRRMHPHAEKRML